MDDSPAWAAHTIQQFAGTRKPALYGAEGRASAISTRSAPSTGRTAWPPDRARSNRAVRPSRSTVTVAGSASDSPPAAHPMRPDLELPGGRVAEGQRHRREPVGGHALAGGQLRRGLAGRAPQRYLGRARAAVIDDVEVLLRLPATVERVIAGDRQLDRPARPRRVIDRGDQLHGRAGVGHGDGQLGPGRERPVEAGELADEVLRERREPAESVSDL